MFSNRVIGYILAFTGAVFFSTKAILVKLAYREYDTDFITLLFLRMSVALPLYLIIWWLSRKSVKVEALQRKDYLYILFLGISGYYLASMFDFIGLKYITASLERVILFAYPTLVLVLSALLFKRSISRLQAVAIIVTYLGIFLAFGKGLDQDSSNWLIGGFFVFLSALAFAFYIIGSGEAVKKIGTRKLTIFAMSVSAILIIIHYIIDKGFHSVFTIEAGLWQYGIGMATIATVVPSFMIIEGIKRLGSSDAAIVGSIGPISTIILAYFFLGEVLSPMQILGTFIVLAGVSAISLKKEKVGS